MQNSKILRQKNGRAATTPRASVASEDENVIEICKILATWNPLGNVEAAAIGLSDYEAEAIDILYVMELYEYSAKKAMFEILQDAFQIDLKNSELDHYGRKIEAVLAKK